MGLSAAPAARRKRAVESFKTAADCIGPVERDMSLFAVTRGQFSMIDAVLHVLDCVGPAKVSLWTWTIAEYEVQSLDRLRLDKRVTGARLIIDAGARAKNAGLISQWQDAFGPDSVRYVVNHAKIALVEGENGMKVCLRGSMNLNFNPRFEQLDVTEGGPDFDLVREIEDELPILSDKCSNAQAWSASKVSEAYTAEELEQFKSVKPFGGVKVWAK